VPLHIPALREHREDVPDLINFYTNTLVNQKNLPYRHFSLAAQNRLRNYEWLGNIRELKNAIKRHLLFIYSKIITADMLKLPNCVSDNLPPLEKMEKMVFKDYFIKTNGNIAKMSRILQRAEGTIRKKLLQYGLINTPS